MGCCLPVEKWRGERLERVKAQGRPQVLFTALISVVLLRRLQNITTLWFVVITSETTEDSFAGWHRAAGTCSCHLVVEKCIIENKYYLGTSLQLFYF
jgi:hypothetical protein